jgi:hypothetical protein
MVDAEADPKVTLDVGGGHIENVEAFAIHLTMGKEGNSASAEIRTNDLGLPGIAYIGEASMDETQGTDSRRLMTGLVDRVSIEGEISTILIAGFHQELRETRLGGFAPSDGVPPEEKIYTILRAVGWPYARTNLGSWSPGPAEIFTVSTPIVGATLTRDHLYGDVLFTNSNPCDVEPDNSDLREHFFGAGVWAVVSIEAETLFDAEVLGLDVIDEGVSTLRALGAYRYPTIDGAPLPYSRAQSRASVYRSNVAFVKSIASGRYWLRLAGKAETKDPLDVDNVSHEALGEFTHSSEPKMFKRSIREWRAAADSIDDYDRVAHLWRSIECYSNREDNGELFSTEERKAIRAGLEGAGTWTDDQAARIKDLVATFNNRPLLQKFRMALEADEIELSDRAFEMIRATRRLRNDLEHASALSEPEHRLLDSAIAEMNYVLVTAIVRYTKRSPG